MNMHMPSRPDSFEPEREDVLIGRVVDSEASSADWDELERLSKSDPALWERVGRAQRAHARLEREVEDAIAIAELIDLPSERGFAATPFHARLRQWGGWAAAAMIGLAWVGFARQAGPGQNAGISFNPSPQPLELSPEELLSQYVSEGVRSGRVVSEMPAMLVEARDLASGKGKEVWFVRPILERATVTDLSVLSVQKDEHGTPRYVPAPFGIPEGVSVDIRTTAEERLPAGGQPL